MPPEIMRAERPNTSRSATGPRFEALDGWRGVAALSVALFHLSAAGHFYSLAWVREAGMFVDLFFVLSGFVISHSYLGKLGAGASLGDFLLRRFGRVWPLHIFTLAILVFLELTKLLLLRGAHLSSGAGVFTDETSIPALLSNIALLQSLGLHHAYTWNGPSWSISAEFWTYVLFGIIARYARRYLLAAGLTLALLSAALLYLYDLGVGRLYEWGLFRCLLCFFTGVLVQNLYRRLPAAFSSSSWEWVALSVTIVLASASTVADLLFIRPIVFGFLVLVFAHQSGPLSSVLRTRPMQRLGEQSYSIYLLHFCILTGLNSAIRVIQQMTGVHLRESVEFAGKTVDMINIGHSALLNDVLALGYLASVCWASSLTYRYVEDPARRFFNGIARRQSFRVMSSSPAT
jgi:peptidoglycan/LPS O-acetylase OafA/YrhL